MANFVGYIKCYKMPPKSGVSGSRDHF